MQDWITVLAEHSIVFTPWYKIVNTVHAIEEISLKWTISDTDHFKILSGHWKGLLLHTDDT